MMTEELYINDVLVPLASVNSIATTYQAHNIAELQDRNADFSNIFQIPKNQISRALFENADLLNSMTTVPYRRLRARYVQDGIELVREGFARLMPSNARYYNVQVVGGNASFFGLFPEMKVSELIGDTLDHVNDFDTIVGSRLNTSGYIYPLIDWNEQGIETQFMTQDIDAKRLLPCVFIKDIFQLTDELTGFDSYGALKDLPDFDNLILTPDALQRDQAAKELYNAKAQVTTPQTVKAGINHTPAQPTSVYYTPTMGIAGNGFTSSTYTADVGLYGYFVFSGQVQLTYKRYEFISRLVIGTAQVVRDSDGAVIAQEEFYNFLSVLDPSESDLTLSLPFNVITNNITFVAGESYHVRFRLQDTQKATLVIDETCVFEFCLEAVIPYGGFMPVGELYEGVTVKQVYQDVMNMYASFPAANSFQRRVRFGLMRELTDNMPNAKDWSDRVDGIDYELGYTFGKYGQVNRLRYKADSTVSLYYGDSSFTIDDENLIDEVLAVQLGVSAVEDETRFQGKLYPRIKALDSARQYTPTNNRILLLDKQDTAYEHRYTDTVDEAFIDTDVPYATFRPLMFDALVPEYYSEIVAMTTRTKAPVLRMRLSRQDVQELDYFTPIYLDVHREDLDMTGYFYLSQVANYVNGFASVSLVRL
jgi:hypothetical protein